MKSKRTILAAASLLVMLAASGCQREATGQVVAVVNGEEITLQEVNAELKGVQIPPNADRKLVQQAALQRVVERRLIAQAARKEGVDKDQDYLLGKQRLDDTLLAQLLGDRTGRTFRIPDQATIDRFIAARPGTFRGRTIYEIDRVQFPVPANPNQLQALKDDHSMAAVLARLDSMGIRYVRAPSRVDSATLTPQLLQGLQKLPAGEPFAIREGVMMSVGVITGNTSAPMPEDESRTLAVQLMRQEAVTNALKQQYLTARAAAKIDYQPGFAPPANRPAPAARP